MTANTAAAPTTSTGKSNSAKVTRLTITASRNLGRVGDNRSIRARRRAALARMTLTAINATPTASAAAKPRKASQTFQSPIESVIGAPAQSPPWWGTNERPCLGSGSPDRGVMHHLAQAPQEAPGGGLSRCHANNASPAADVRASAQLRPKQKPRQGGRG